MILREDFKIILDKLQIKFEPITHKYTRYNHEVPSVNGIIDRVMGNVFKRDTIYMRQARDKGTLIHSAINKFIVENKIPDFPMIEFDNFLKLSNKHKITWDLSEQIIYNNIDGMEYCGTLDLFSFLNEEISDIKTGSTKQLKKWTIQLSMYAQALRDIFGVKVSKGSILWLHDEIAEYIPIKLLSKQEIIDFLMKYYTYNTNTPKEENIALKCLNKEAIQEFNETLTAIEVMQDKVKEIKEKILLEMEQRQITQIKLGSRVISYVAPTTRETIDTKRLKEKYTKVWLDCRKESEVSASIRIK